MKPFFNISKIIWISTFLLLKLCPVLGQSQKQKNVTPKDFQLWSTLQEAKISDNGKWTSYVLSYESGMDTLFIKNNYNQKTFHFAKGFNANFCGANHVGCQLPDNKFKLTNLENYRSYTFENVSKFTAAYKGILLEKSTLNNTIELQLIDYNGQIVQSLSNVVYYVIDPTNSLVAYVTSMKNNSLALLDLKNGNTKTTIATSDTLSFPIIKWHTLGTSLLFAASITTENEIKYEKVCFYKIKEKKLLTFDPKINRALPDTMKIDARYLKSLRIATNEKYVYFSITSTQKKENPNNENVQIWNVADKEIYPRRELLGDLMTNQRMVKWNTTTNEITLIGDNQHPRSYGHVDQPNVLLYNEDENKPSFTQNPLYTYWIFNTETKKKSIFLKGLPSKGSLYNFSPQGNYFVYCRNLNWWLYRFETEEHVNITGKYKDQFINHDVKSEVLPSAYEFAGWSKNDASFFIYDEFDIWEFNSKTGERTQLTFGRKNKDIYRLAKSGVFPQYNLIDTEPVLIPEENCILQISKNNNTFYGWAYLDTHKKIHSIAYEPKLLTDIQKAKNADTYLYSKQDFKTPPSLCLFSKNSTKKLFQSNSNYYKYAWGESKLITFQNSKGATLNGVLLFLANYNPAIQYPMIVYIYEKLTAELNKYTNPSYQYGSVLNLINCVNDGYFVLLPDIEYEIGNPGISATDCVVSAVQQVTANYPINKKKIGLTGHSFGGYETDFIITQTNMFAAAASGAPVTHFNSNYLEYDSASIQPQTWRYEFHQMRMGKILWDDFTGYQNNSPLTFAANIATPLLTSTGSLDLTVSPKQSIAFYMALRRLQKEHILLIYPNQEHVFSSNYAQEDLNKKMKEWFDYYLKDKSKPEWMIAH